MNIYISFHKEPVDFIYFVPRLTITTRFLTHLVKLDLHLEYKRNVPDTSKDNKGPKTSYGVRFYVYYTHVMKVS